MIHLRLCNELLKVSMIGPKFKARDGVDLGAIRKIGGVIGKLEPSLLLLSRF